MSSQMMSFLLQKEPLKDPSTKNAEAPIPLTYEFLAGIDALKVLAQQLRVRVGHRSPGIFLSLVAPTLI
jgi:hypothetical protein